MERQAFPLEILSGVGVEFRSNKEFVGERVIDMTLLLFQPTIRNSEIKIPFGSINFIKDQGH